MGNESGSQSRDVVKAYKKYFELLATLKDGEELRFGPEQKVKRIGNEIWEFKYLFDDEEDEVDETV
jgi:hypothetical protein